MICLASSGDEAKIWDVPTFSLLEQFNPFDGSITDFTWSHDGYSIASCCSTDKTVYLRLTRTPQSVPSDTFVLPAGCQCLDYNSSSRFLLCGCVDGSIHIWDSKSRTIKNVYTNSKHPVMVARWNWNDTYISLGLENGSILLYNVATSQASSPLVTPSVNTIRQLRYNPYQKSSLVSVSDGGAVNFWDTNTRRMVHSFTETHQAPARDLVFSPINDYLMVSVGLDKRAVLYDVQSKSSINTVVAEHPLTSVDIMQDGTTIIVGTTRGKIFFYDIRQLSEPVYNFLAHKSSVKHVSFVRKGNSKNDSLSHGLRRQLPIPPTSFIDAQNQSSNNSNIQSPRNNSYLTGLDIFSPLGNMNKSSDSVIDKTSSEKSWMHNLSKSLTGDVFTTGDGVFSPVRFDNSHSINSTHNRSSILSNNSFLTQVLSQVENVNKDHLNSHSNNLYSIGEVPVEKGNTVTMDGFSSLPAKETTPESSPKPLLQRGIGASPSLQQLSPQRVGDIDSTSCVNKASPPRPTTTSPFTFSLPRNRVSLGDRSQAVYSVNGSASSHSPQTTHQRSEDKLSDPLHGINGTTPSSPSRHSNSSHHRPSSDPVSSLSMIESSATSSVRHLLQDLLKEQFQEHKEQMKAEIRTFLSYPNHNTLGASQHSNPTSLPNQGKIEMFHAEFIRHLIREELEDVKEFIHKEFWCIQIELIKQVFNLQKNMEAKLAECAINPILLDEIYRLSEENSRLKKTF